MLVVTIDENLRFWTTCLCYTRLILVSCQNSFCLNSPAGLFLIWNNFRKPIAFVNISALVVQNAFDAVNNLINKTYLSQEKTIRGWLTKL